MVRRFLLFSLLACALAGCGEAPAPEESADIEVVPGAPAPLAQPPDATGMSTDGYITSIGASGGLVVIGTTVRAFTAQGTVAEALDVYGDEPGVPAETGAIRAVARRTEGVFLAAANGLFHTQGAKLLLSPASAELSGLDIIALRATGAPGFEKLLIAAADGIYEVADGKLTKVEIDGETEPPVAVASDEGKLFAAFGPRLYVVNEDRSKATLAPLDVGAIHGMAIGAGDALYLATDGGVVVRDAEGGYSQYTLSDGDEPVVAEAVTLDPQQGMYAVTSAGVVLFPPEDKPAIVAEVAGSPPIARVATTDDAGTLWLGEGDMLRGFALGEPVSFAEDVAPVLKEYCATCHETGESYAPVIDYTSYEATVDKAQVMIEKMSAGLMPPADATRLPPEKYELILRWYGSGKNP